jgi:hypothetical protein
MVTISLLLIVFIYFLTSFVILKDFFIAALTSVYHLIGIMTSIVLIPGSDIWLFHDYLYVFNFENLFIVILSNSILFILILYSKKMFEDENRFHRSIIIFVNFATFGLILYYHFFNDIRILDQYYITGNKLFKSVFLIVVVFYYQLFIAVKYYYEIITKNKIMNEEMIRNSIEFENLSKQQSYDILDQIRNYLNENNFEKISNITDEFLIQNDACLKSKSFRNLENLYLSNYLQKTLEENPEVTFSVEINHKETMQKFNKEKYFLEIIGIILDNAIYASKQSKDKIVRLIVSDNSIKVINSYHKDDLTNLVSDSSKKGNKNRINGLKLLKHITKKSDITVIKTIQDYVCFEMVVE